MIKISIVKPLIGPNTKDIHGVEVPAVPSVGHYLDHEPSGISGTVERVQWWWPDDKRRALVIEVRLSR